MEIKVETVDKFIYMKDLKFGSCFVSGDNYYMKIQQQHHNNSHECVNIRTGAVASFEAGRRVMPMNAVVTLTNLTE